MGAASAEWTRLRAAHPTCHPLHLAIDATVLSYATGPNAVLLEQWVAVAMKARVDGFYGLPSEPQPCALLLPILPFPDAARVLAFDLLRRPTVEDEPNRHVAAGQMILPGEWSAVLVKASRRRAHMVVTEFLAVLEATKVGDATRERYKGIQKLMPQPRAKDLLGHVLTPEQREWAKEMAQRAAPRAAVAVASIGLAELAGLGALVKIAADIVGDLSRLTGDVE